MRSTKSQFGESPSHLNRLQGVACDKYVDRRNYGLLSVGDRDGSLGHSDKREPSCAAPM